MRDSNTKIKIAYVIDRLGTGGTERQLKLLADGLDRNKFEPFLYLLRGESDHPMKPSNLSCTVLNVNTIGSIGGLSRILSFSRMLRKEGCHIVQTFFQDSAFCGTLAGRLAMVQCILVSVRDMLFWADFASIGPLRSAMRCSNGIIVNSDAVREKIRHLAGKKRIWVIPNGIEVGNGYVKNTENKKKLTKELNISPASTLVVTVANCNRSVKRVDLLIEAASEIFKHEKAHFVIIGDGDLRPKLEQRTADLGLSESVKFLGRRNDVPSLLAGSDIYVNTSDSEGLSNSIMEAMRAGLPVVASDVRGNRELISHNINGLLFAPGDANDLAARIIYLINNKNANSFMGRMSIDVINDKYRSDRIINQYSSLYSSTLKLF